MGFFGIEPNENPFSKWAETWRGGVNSFFEWVAPNDTVYNVTNSILDMAVSCIPIVGDIRDGVEVITGVSMITGEKLSVAERLITAACFFIPLVGASFVRESGQGIVKFIGKHWDEAMQFASKYIDEGITLLSKHGGDFLMNIAKKGDEGLTLLKKAFNFGDEIALAGGGTVKLEPEVSTKLQDFVSKITGKVDDVASSGTVKRVDKAEADVSSAFKQKEFASSYEARISQTPAELNLKVGFEGKRGESLCTLKPPPNQELKKILDEAGINGIQYKNGVPDFSPVSKAEVEINYMLGGKGVNGAKARNLNFEQANIALAKQLNSSPELANEFGMVAGNIKASDIEKYRIKNNLTWHELNDTKIMQLVPTKINSTFGHLGGVGEINAGAYKID